MNILFVDALESSSSKTSRIHRGRCTEKMMNQSADKSLPLFEPYIPSLARLFFLIIRRTYPRLCTRRASFHLLYRIGKPTFPSFTSIAIAGEMGLHWNLKHQNWTHFEQRWYSINIQYIAASNFHIGGEERLFSDWWGWLEKVSAAFR